jgi:hypothetical protein
MTEFINYLLSSSGSWVWLAVAILGAFIIYVRHDSFRLTDLTYRFPIIGKLARYSKDYSEISRGGWLNVEASLCHDYARHVTAFSKADFERNTEYLRKAYDHGRRPIPLPVFALISLLVLLEGLGFSYLLGSWMAIESSENERLLLTIAIVIVIAAILVWVTHSAGHQLYRTRLLRSCFQQYQASLIDRIDERTENRSEKARVFSSGILSLREGQSVDDEMPPHVQCANRVASRPDDVGSYAWVWLAAILVIVIAVTTVVLRIETLHSSELGSSPLIPAIFEGASGSGGAQEAAAAREIAALSSFAILSVIFVVTQLVGMGVGYRYGFASKQGREAFDATGGCADYEIYFRPIRRRMSIADLRLTTLHRLMEKRLPHEIDWRLADGRERDFLEFIREERRRGATDLQDPTNLDGRDNASPGTNGSQPPAGLDKRELGQGGTDRPANQSDEQRPEA